MIAGALSRSSRSKDATIRNNNDDVSLVESSLDLLTELESTGTVEPIVLFITAYMLEGGVATAGHFFFEVSLIRCEGSTSSCTQQQQQGSSSNIANNLGFERFSTLSSVGGSMMACSTGDIKCELDKLRVAVDSALRIANDISKVGV